MTEFVRLILLLAIAGAAVTLFVAAAGWFMTEDRRMARAFRKVLGHKPDAALIAHGRGRGAAFCFASGRLAVAWDAGAWCLVYGLEELIGGELALDGEVVGRVSRGEPRRALDRLHGAKQQVSLRLLFDDPQHPDFELILWPALTAQPGAPAEAGAAIGEANRWLARAEAVLRRAAAADTAQVARAPAAADAPPASPTVKPEPPPWDDDDEDHDDLDEDEQGQLPI